MNLSAALDRFSIEMASNDPLHKIVKGYPKLAARMEIQPELAIYRRFGALNAQNLLYLQAELEMLEKNLRKQQIQDDNDKQGNGPRYAKDWYWLNESKTGTKDEQLQLQLVLQIRSTLKAYNDALIQQATILNYPKPGDWDLRFLQNYLENPEMGQLVFEGEDASIWGSVNDRESHKPDLITLRPRKKKDRFSVWAAENTISHLEKFGCARFMRVSPVHGVLSYEDETIFRITYWITSIIASLIPIASIAILYCVQSMPGRLGIIAVFNVLVSICLMGLANAKRAEVFAITAAFAAVQVVFVGTDKNT